MPAWQPSAEQTHLIFWVLQYSCRYCVMQLEYSGLADRLSSAVTVFSYCLLSKRAFQLQWMIPGKSTGGRNLSVALTSAFIDWTYKSPESSGTSMYVNFYVQDEPSKRKRDNWYLGTAFHQQVGFVAWKAPMLGNAWGVELRCLFDRGTRDDRGHDFHFDQQLPSVSTLSTNMQQRAIVHGCSMHHPTSIAACRIHHLYQYHLGQCNLPSMDHLNCIVK